MRQGTRLFAGVLAVVAAGGAAVALGVALLLGNIVHLRSTANTTLRTGAYLTAAINLEGLVLDAETGLRGYVITGKPLFLAPERTAAAQLPGVARLELQWPDEQARLRGPQKVLAKAVPWMARQSDRRVAASAA